MTDGKKRHIITFADIEQSRTETFRRRNCSGSNIIRSYRPSRASKLDFIDLTNSEYNELSKDDNIIDIEEDRFDIRLDITSPNDPLFVGLDLWPLYNGTQPGNDIKAKDAWDFETGDGSVVVAIIDTGIDINHPDLAANIWVNPSPTFGDHNGAAFFNGGSQSPHPNDIHYHGTHVAGTVAAVGNNSIGMTGVIWDAKLMGVRIFTATAAGVGAYTSDAIAGILYAADNGADIMNCSWGGGPYSVAMRNAFIYAGSNGITSCCAAGNDAKHVDAWPMYPAYYGATGVDSILSVASHDRENNHSYFSNYSPKSVNINAPGSDVVSCIPDELAHLGIDGEPYYPLSGTSMASPHIAGAASLLKNYSSSLTSEEIKFYLEEGTINDANYSERSIAGGRLNIDRPLRLLSFPAQVRGRITDIDLETDLDDVTITKITWKNPTHSDFSKVVVCASTEKFANTITEDVIYEGTAETFNHTDIEAGIQYYYTFWPVYTVSSTQRIGPREKIRSLGGGGPFWCPPSPPGTCFICNFWDETWLGLGGSAFMESPKLSQMVRACHSKRISRGQKPRYPWGLFGCYPMLDPTDYSPGEKFDVIHPTAQHCLDRESIAHGSMFIAWIVDEIKLLLTPLEKYCLALEKNSCYVWLDYYSYLETGVLRNYKPPVEIFQFTEEDCKDRENWYTILITVREILQNLRVMYTAEPPWKVIKTTWEIGTVNSGEQDVVAESGTTSNKSIGWSNSPTNRTPSLPSLDTCLYSSTGIAPIYLDSSSCGHPRLSDPGFDLINVSNIHTKNATPTATDLLLTPELLWFRGFNDEPQMTVPAYIYVHDGTNSAAIIDTSYTYYYYPPETEFQLSWGSPSVVDGDRTVDEEDFFGDAGLATLNLTMQKTVNEFWNRYENDVYNKRLTPENINQNRTYAEQDALFLAHPSWDWEEKPIDFHVFLEIEAKSGGYDGETTTGVSEKTENFPGVLDEDHVVIDYTTPAGDGSYTAYIRQMWNTPSHKLTIPIGTFTVDDQDELEFPFTLRIHDKFCWETVVDCSKQQINDRIIPLTAEWWTQVYEMRNPSGTWNFSLTSLPGDSKSFKWKNQYVVGAWGGVTARLIVRSEFEICQVPQYSACLRSPYLLKYDEEEVEYRVPSTLEVGEKNVQIHYDYLADHVHAQCPTPGSIVPSDTPIHYTYSGGAESEFSDTSFEKIPKVIGLTLEEAEAFISAYDGWSIDSTNISYQYSYDIPKDIIIGQNPWWTTQKTPISRILQISISLGSWDLRYRVVPQLRFESEDDIEDILSYHGLSLNPTINAQIHPSIPEKYIISQTPVYGTLVPKGTPVSVTTSIGWGDVDSRHPGFPLLRWKNISEVPGILTSAGLSLGSISYAHSDEIPEDHVISQNPRSDRIFISPLIDITVSLGPLDTICPPRIREFQQLR